MDVSLILVIRYLIRKKYFKGIIALKIYDESYISRLWVRLLIELRCQIKAITEQ